MVRWREERRENGESQTEHTMFAAECECAQCSLTASEDGGICDLELPKGPRSIFSPTTIVKRGTYYRRKIISILN